MARLKKVASESEKRPMGEKKVKKRRKRNPRLKPKSRTFIPRACTKRAINIMLKKLSGNDESVRVSANVITAVMVYLEQYLKRQIEAAHIAMKHRKRQTLREEDMTVVQKLHCIEDEITNNPITLSISELKS